MRGAGESGEKSFFPEAPNSSCAGHALAARRRRGEAHTRRRSEEPQREGEAWTTRCGLESTMLRRDSPPSHALGRSLLTERGRAGLLCLFRLLPPRRNQKARGGRSLRVSEGLGSTGGEGGAGSAEKAQGSEAQRGRRLLSVGRCVPASLSAKSAGGGLAVKSG